MASAAPIIDLFEVHSTDDLVFPKIVRGAEGEHLPLSVMHSYMPRYKAESTCRAYEAGQRLFFSSPTINKLQASGLFSSLGSKEQIRLLTAQLLEVDFGAKLTAANDAEAFYVDPRDASPTVIKRVLLGMRVGMSILQSMELYADANPFLCDFLPSEVRFTTSPKGGHLPPAGDDLRKLLYGVPSFFRVAGSKWRSAGRIVSVPMDEVYKAAVDAGWGPGHLLILRIVIESGCRLSEALALTVLDWLLGSDFGSEFEAINKGSRGQRLKKLGVTQGCVRDATRYVEQDRTSRFEPKLNLDDYRQKYRDGRLEELNVPLVPSRTGGHYTRSGFYGHVFAPTMAKLGIRGHDPRHAFVSRCLDLIYAEHWDDPVTLKVRERELIDYMGWSCGELMLFLYSRRHREAQGAELKARFHEALVADEAAALGEGVSKIPRGCSPNLVQVDEYDEWLAEAAL